MRSFLKASPLIENWSVFSKALKKIQSITTAIKDLTNSNHRKKDREKFVKIQHFIR